jgi:hypothetical protein
VTPGFRHIGRWIDLPTSGGPNDRLRADQPLSSGVMQILQNNAVIASRANSLRTLWNGQGIVDCSGTLGFGVTAGVGTRVDQFNWNADPFTPGNVAVWYAGCHRIRPYGETGFYPGITISGRGMAGGTSTTGLILLARALPGCPDPGDAYAVATTTSNTMVSLSATITSENVRPVGRLIAPRDESAASGTAPAEQGRDEALHLWVGVYTDGGGGGKATVRAITIYLTPPPV